MKKINKRIIFTLLIVMLILSASIALSNSKAMDAEAFNVTFDPNGGTVESVTKTLHNGDKYGRLPIPTRDGYTFNGWFIRGFTPLSYEDPFYDSYFGRNVLRLAPGHPTSNGMFKPGCVLVFDITIGNTVPIGIDINDNDISSSEYTIDGNRVYGEITITNEHYNYWGYNSYSFLDINCASSVSSYTINNAKLYTNTPGDEKITSETVFNETKDVTLIADWKEDTYYTVEFDTNRANEEIGNERIKEGEKAIKPEDPTKDSCIFLGWYVDEELTTPFDFSKPITSNITIYAKWEPVYHDVTIKITDGMVFEEDELTFEQLIGIELLAYRGMLTESEEDNDDEISYICDKNGKKLFTVDEDGKVIFSDGVSFLDNIEYVLTDEDKELIAEEIGELFINRVLFSFGDVQYEILEGANQAHKIGDAKDMIVKANGLLSKFVALKIDGVIVDEANYEKAEGSTIVTLKAAYLDTLKPGEHQMTLVYNDGEVSTNFTITQNNPATGDNIYVWFSLMFASIIGIMGTAKVSKKVNK